MGYGVFCDLEIQRVNMLNFMRKTRCSLLGHERTLKMLSSSCQSIYHLLGKDVESFLTPTSEIMAYILTLLHHL